MSTVRPQRGRPSPITLPAGRPEGADAFCSPLARAARCNLRGNANRIGHSVAAAYSQTSPGDPPPRGSLRGNDVPPQLTRDPRGTSAQPKNKTHQNFISNVRWKWDGSGGLPPARGPGAAEAPGCRNGTKIVWKRGWVLGVPNLDKRRLIRYTNLVKASGESECQTLSRIPEFFRLVRREPVSPSPKKKNMSGLPGTFGTWPEP